MQYIQQSGEVIDLLKKGDVVVYKKEVLEGTFIAEFVKEMERNGDRLLIIKDQELNRVRVRALSGSEKGNEWNSSASRLRLVEPKGLEGAVKLV